MKHINSGIVYRNFIKNPNPRSSAFTQKLNRIRGAIQYYQNAKNDDIKTEEMLEEERRKEEEKRKEKKKKEIKVNMILRILYLMLIVQKILLKIYLRRISQNKSDCIDRTILNFIYLEIFDFYKTDSINYITMLNKKN